MQKNKEEKGEDDAVIKQKMIKMGERVSVSQKEDEKERG